jgi:ATP-dependent Lon protease
MKKISPPPPKRSRVTLVIVCPVKPEHEGEREYDSIYDAGVIGTIMRKVVLPDGRIKVLFQGLARGHIEEMVHDNPLRAHVDLISSMAVNELKMDAILEVLREKVRALSQVSNYFPPDLFRTIEENHEYNRIVDLDLQLDQNQKRECL